MSEQGIKLPVTVHKYVKRKTAALFDGDLKRFASHLKVEHANQIAAALNANTCAGVDSNALSNLANGMEAWCGRVISPTHELMQTHHATNFVKFCVKKIREQLRPQEQDSEGSHDT